MDTLAVIARKRAVMTTIADAIVVASVGKDLRVAIGCTHHDELAFADQLAQAMYARGRPCRCVPTGPAGDPGNGPRTGHQVVAVIVSGKPGTTGSDLCRVDIRLQRPAPGAAPVCCAGGDHRADIVVEYLPEGPTIRYLAPRLASAPGRA